MWWMLAQCHFLLFVITSFTVLLWLAYSWIGKTLLAKTLARFVNVPFVIADATTLTQVKLGHSSCNNINCWNWDWSCFSALLSVETWLFLLRHKMGLLLQAGYVGEDVESILYKLLTVSSCLYPFKTSSSVAVAYCTSFLSIPSSVLPIWWHHCLLSQCRLSCLLRVIPVYVTFSSVCYK